MVELSEREWIYILGRKQCALCSAAGMGVERVCWCMCRLVGDGKYTTP